jgi:hypothetical protein
MADLASLRINTQSLTSDEKLWGALSHIPLIGLLALFALDDKKNNPYIRYNAITSVTLALLTTVISMVTCGVGSVVAFAHLYYAYVAYQGQLVEVPWLTNFLIEKGHLNSVKQITGAQ